MDPSTISADDIISMLQAQLTQHFDEHQQARAPDRFNHAIDKCLGQDRVSTQFQRAGFFPWFAYCVHVASLHGDDDALQGLADADLSRVAGELATTPVDYSVRARVVNIFYGSKRACWRHGRVSSRVEIPTEQELLADNYQVEMSQSTRALKMPEDYLNPEG